MAAALHTSTGPVNGLYHLILILGEPMHGAVGDDEAAAYLEFLNSNILSDKTDLLVKVPDALNFAKSEPDSSAILLCAVTKRSTLDRISKAKETDFSTKLSIQHIQNDADAFLVSYDETSLFARLVIGFDTKDDDEEDEDAELD